MSSKTVAFLAVQVVLIYCAYRAYYKDDTGQSLTPEEEIISIWEERIKLPTRQFKKVAVGLNANVDLIVKGSELLRMLNISPGHKLDHHELNSLHELQEVFAFFLAKGSGAERNFANGEDFGKMVDAAERLSRADWFIGGNAALMAQKIITTFPDTQVQLVGPVGPRLKSLLDQNMQVPQSSRIDKDEVHMILEFERGEKWGDHQAPVATRFITSHDLSNARMDKLETLFASLGSFQPDLVILSGLHIMEGQSEDFLKKRLEDLAGNLRLLPSTVPVHLELASMTKPWFMKLIMEIVLPTVSSLGLNEQELAFASHATDGPHNTMYKEIKGQPEIHKVSDIMTWLLKTYSYGSKNYPNSKLTRVHFHSLTYHITGTLNVAWRNERAAVAAGTRIAAKQACDMKIFDPTKVDIKSPEQFKLFTGDKLRSFNQSEPVLSWKTGDFKFCFSPVLVCKHPLKTVGLGDAISATGLLFSEYDAKYADQS
ncbi:unnamed protein product [Owenia fusiformis]|uniref:Uncharacterized protein n=1 Tax=Owenia fusiformis TaxID=6347 RepID=A0A8J1XU94_OWEFU|nr:unnamed protein product [Owenia fusiformis]